MASTSTQKSLTASAFRATPLPKNGETGEAVQTIVSGRKCWRIMKGKDEAVWPPALEAALIEGLEKYKPTESRSTRSLGRFPMRNKFISDHIFETTGKRRTPKQVGSRIQQLRDTNSGKQILKTYSDRHYEMMRPSRPAVPEQEPRAESPESVNSDTYSSSPSPAPQTNHVYIEVLPPRGEHTSYMLSPSYLSRSAAAVNAVDDFRVLGPRLLRHIDPTVTFTSPTPVSCYSSFIVMKDGQFVCSELTSVDECQPMASGSSTSAFVYRTMLVPKVWAQLCDSEEPEAYTISQEIVLAVDASSVPPHASSSNSTILSSITYHFINAAAASRALSPNPSVDGSVHSDTLSSAIRTPDFPPDFDDYLMLAPPPMDMLPPPSGPLDEPLLIPDLLNYGDEGYASFPSSPSEVSALSTWPCFEAEVQSSSQQLGCDTYFPSIAPFPTVSCFDESPVLDLYF
ncbi:hypothetical protein EUX98_g2464 [Antrodiella citrinella]|uniref:TEA domain-containing protein n=1 Tax=Antrodiella citrinella TaxID=2447956 RepID=A0A4S4MYZ3_9APHY|nr:hypothetical protein EUX98_g2464 [Antrodiella citrinella]